MSNLKKVLIFFLAINALMQIAMGVMMLQDFQQVATSMLNLTYSEGMTKLGVTLGMKVLSLGIVLLLSIYWVFRNNKNGASLAILFGAYVVIAGIVSYSQGVSEGLTMDVPRGIIILVLGYFTQRQDKMTLS